MEKLPNMIKSSRLKKNSFIPVLLWIGLIVFSCQKKEQEIITYIETPAFGKSSEPSLHLSIEGVLYLSWTETDSLKNTLKFSHLNSSDTWSEATTIANGNNWFVNWADFPALTTFGDNIAAHYLEKSAEDTYAYDVNMTISNDKGLTWNPGFIPHNDSTNTEHGFVSKIGIDDTSFLAIWLDGRQYAYAEKDTTLHKQMALRSSKINSDGTLMAEHVVDPRVCDCCQTDLASTTNSIVAVYRDRSDTEVRDIYFSRFIEDSWMDPKPVYNDNWVIPGCPVNGPAIDSYNDLVATSWFSMSDNIPEVKVAFLEADAESFAMPIALDYINPLGRVDLELIDQSTALVSWMDSYEDITKIQLQTVQKNGQKGEVFTLTEISNERSSGFPKMVTHQGYVYVTWTEVSDTLQIRTARIKLLDIR
jgi:hypothetical protein